MALKEVQPILFQSQYGLILASLFTWNHGLVRIFQSQYGLILAQDKPDEEQPLDLFQSQYGLILAIMKVLLLLKKL